MEKLQRNYRLTISQDGWKEDIVISYPLTMEFSVNRAALSSAGTASIKVFNLNQDHRSKIQKNIMQYSIFMGVKLEAGYGENRSVIFNGNAYWARSFKESGRTDFITELSGFDFGYVIQNKATLSLTGQGASQKNVIKTLCGCLTYPLNGTQVLPIGAIGKFDDTPRTKYELNDYVWPALVKETGDNCYIDNGKVYCMGQNEVVSKNVPVIDTSTGLLGTPKVDGIYTIFETIFEPSIINGQRVQLISQDSPEFNGVYKVISLDHSGIISGAMAGQCKTRITCIAGSNNKNDPFSVLTEGQ